MVNVIVAAAWLFLLGLAATRVLGGPPISVNDTLDRGVLRVLGGDVVHEMLSIEGSVITNVQIAGRHRIVALLAIR